MQQNTIETHIGLASSRASHIFAASALGFIILLFVGFAPINAIHNAAHDSRHSVSFPCH